MKIRRILHPTDFSSASTPAFKTALGLARGHEMLVLHVLTPLPLIGDAYVAATTYDRLRRAQALRAQKQLGRLCARARAAGVRVKGLLRESASPSRQIVRVARARRADLIVMGTHGRGVLARVFVGSVAQRVVATATCPVLTVRAK